MSKTSALIALLLFLGVACGAVETASSDPAAELLQAAATGRAMFFDLDPAFGDLIKPPADVKSPKFSFTIRSTGGYVLKIKGTRGDRRLELEFTLNRRDGRAFTTKSYGITANTDKLRYFKDADFPDADHKAVAGNRSLPVIYAEDGDANCPGLIGFANQIEAAQVGEAAEIVKLSRPAEWETITAREIKDGFYLDFSGRYWFDALKDYAAFADRYRDFKPRPIPPQAYEPVWCSWYTLTTGVNESNIWENAVIAKSLGFGTILIDAGWDTPGSVCMKDDSTYGDRYAYRGKFPHMTEMVDRIHSELGMAVELWASPWSIGFKARAAREIADVRTGIGTKQNPSFFLCPRCKKSGEFLARNLSDVFKYYHVDGMWWDFLDSVPIHNCHRHKHDYQTYGQGYNANMTRIMDAIHAVKPDALIEIRLKSSNINNKLFANVLETYDTPLWFQDNRQLLVYVRAFVAGCVPKTDPTMWQRSSEEGLKNPPNDLVGRFMATMITVGVPSVSQDFTKMPEDNRRVVKAYLDFYHAHKADLIAADFRPIGRDKMRAHYVIEGRDAYVYSGTQDLPELTLRKPHQTLYLFSAAEKPGVKLALKGLQSGQYTWQARNHFMDVTASGTVEVKPDGLAWDAPVPSGGMLELRL